MYILSARITGRFFYAEIYLDNMAKVSSLN